MIVCMSAHDSYPLPFNASHVFIYPHASEAYAPELSGSGTPVLYMELYDHEL